MRRLAELSLGHRIALTAAIVIAIILLLALIGYLIGRWEIDEAQAEASPPISKYEKHFLQMDREALDEAYKKHIIRLYDIWVTDYQVGKGEPPRAAKGARNARAAYEESLAAIEKREEELRRRQ